MNRNLVVGGWPGFGWWREMWVTKALCGTPEAVVLWKGSKWIDYPSFFFSASSMSLNMLPAMLPTMRLSPWNDFDLLIPIPLQPKAASSRLPWLCLKISERRECWRGWELRTLYSVSLCPYFSQVSHSSVCSVYPLALWGSFCMIYL